MKTSSVLVVGNRTFCNELERCLDRGEDDLAVACVDSLHAAVSRLEDLSVVVVENGLAGGDTDAFVRCTTTPWMILLTEEPHLATATHRLPADVLSRRAGPGAIVRAISRARRLVHIARSEVPVLLTGETGTGKTRMAHKLHLASPRSGKPFRRVNCAALPPTLVEAELFGTCRGAYTGAITRRGLLEESNGGTLVLDEIGELPIAIQAKLLSTVEDKEIRRVGGNDSMTVDVRIMAATHVDIRKAMLQGSFREDLLYRLDVGRVHLPPLRDHEKDCIRGAVACLLAELGIPRARLQAGEYERLSGHRWPGNYRQLRNALQRAMIQDELEALRPSNYVVEPASHGADSSASSTASSTGAANPPIESEPWPTWADVQRKHALKTYDRHGMNVERTAHALQVAPVTLRRWLKKWGAGGAGAQSDAKGRTVG